MPEKETPRERARADLGDPRMDRGIAVAFGTRRRRADPDLRADSVSRFEPLDELSRDATSILLRARDREVDRDVALRIVEPIRDTARFLEEAQVSAQLQHPGIVPVYAFGLLDDGRAFIARRLVEGNTFDDLLARETGSHRLLAVLEQAAHALAFAHAHGVAHGHVTAKRIVVGPHGEVVLTGWDHAVRANGDPAPIREDVRALGTLLVRVADGASDGDLAEFAIRCREPDGAQPRHAGEVARAIGQHLAAEETHARGREIDAARERLRGEEERLQEAAERRRAAVAQKARRWTRRLVTASLLALALGLGGLIWRWQEERVAAHRAGTRVAAALREVSRHEAARRWSEARSWATAAVALAAEADEAVLDRARARLEEQARRPLRPERLFSHLDAIRRHGRRTLAAYSAAFREWGDDFLELDAEQAASRLRLTGEPDRVVTALDEWAVLAWAKRKGDLYRWIHRVVSLLDPDPGRNELRRAPWRDAEEVERLAARVDVARASPATIHLLGLRLASKGRPESVMRLLRSAQRRHPDDRWLLSQLALLPDTVGLPNVVIVKGRYRDRESLAMQTALVAMQPERWLEWMILGRLLRELDLDLSIAALRRSTTLDPAQALPHASLAEALARRGDIQGAIAASRLALDRDSTCAGVRRMLGRTHQRLGMEFADRGDPHEAEASYRRAAEAYELAIEREPQNAAAHADLGRLLCDVLSDPERAVQLFQAALRLDPDKPAYHQNLGTALSKLGKPDKAEASYRRALELAPEDAWAHASLGGMLMRRGNLEKAEQSLRRAIALDPDLALAHKDLGNVLRDTKRLDLACESFREAIRLASASRHVSRRPVLETAWVGLGDILLSQGRGEEALEAYGEAADLLPDEWAIVDRLGTAQSKQDRPDEAIKTYRRALRLVPPDDVTVHLNLGLTLSRLGRFEEVVDVLEEANERDRDNLKVLKRLGRALIHVRRIEKAVAVFSRARTLAPDDVEVLANLGASLLQLGRAADAVRVLERAADLDPKDAVSWNLGQAYYRLGRFEDAVDAFQRASARTPDDAGILLNLGAALYEVGRRDDARAVWREAIKLDPAFAPQCLTNIGMAFRADHRFPEAESAYRHALRLRPDAALLSDLGLVLACQRRWEEAEETYRKALRVDPTEFRALVGLGDVLARTDSARALVLYREALRHQPEHPLVLGSLAWFLATAADPRLRDPGEAVRLARQALALTRDPSRMWSTLGTALYRANRFDEAVVALRKARELDSPVFDRFFLVMAYARLGQREEARRLFDQCLEWLDANAPEDEELRRFRAEAKAAIEACRRQEGKKPK